LARTVRFVLFNAEEEGLAGSKVYARLQRSSGAPIVAVLQAASRHPFVDAGNRFFNALLRFRSRDIGGSLFACDATVWTSAFGGLESLQAFWGNLAKLKV